MNDGEDLFEYEICLMLFWIEEKKVFVLLQYKITHAAISSFHV